MFCASRAFGSTVREGTNSKNVMPTGKCIETAVWQIDVSTNKIFTNYTNLIYVENSHTNTHSTDCVIKN